MLSPNDPAFSAAFSYSADIPVPVKNESSPIPETMWRKYRVTGLDRWATAPSLTDSISTAAMSASVIGGMNLALCTREIISAKTALLMTAAGSALLTAGHWHTMRRINSADAPMIVAQNHYYRCVAVMEKIKTIKNLLKKEGYSSDSLKPHFTQLASLGCTVKTEQPTIKQPLSPEQENDLIMSVMRKPGDSDSDALDRFNLFRKEPELVERIQDDEMKKKVQLVMEQIGDHAFMTKRIIAELSEAERRLSQRTIVLSRDIQAMGQALGIAHPAERKLTSRTDEHEVVHLVTIDPKHSS
ncbi:hypothetical protein EOPP23_09335 [Endozoicomonas sp. OPT23]|uniref:hypothetical protein n=1 Tax=Endozoicomonas sp. OPT23 TaxID=2072845 RepID=UPI00129ABFF4|nr:hypothetical protein [Endozoicomonas sp. OPT23]MRI33185.1 hypothetical protein [Endozoicomonas sp. OPT23]